MKQKVKFLMASLWVALFVLWWGVPTFKKWQADKLVDELCTKDGGIKVYEAVTLPHDRFNQWGQLLVRDKKSMLPSDEYYSVWKVTNIVGKHDSSAIGDLVVYQSHFWIYRTEDKKLLGESISYTRRGADPISWAHPSSYSCTQLVSLEANIFKPFEQ